MVDKARESVREGDLRWAAQVLDHVVFAEPDHVAGRSLLADVLEQLGFGSENGTWRCAYLSGAMELRSGNFGTPTIVTSDDILRQLTPELFFDAVAIQVNGPAAWNLDLAIRWDFPDHGETYRTTMRNGVFSYLKNGAGPVQLTVTIPKPALGPLATGNVDAATSAGLSLDGDGPALAEVLSVLQPGDTAFNIVEP